MSMGDRNGHPSVARFSLPHLASRAPGDFTQDPGGLTNVVSHRVWSLCELPRPSLRSFTESAVTLLAPSNHPSTPQTSRNVTAIYMSVADQCLHFRPNPS